MIFISLTQSVRCKDYEIIIICHCLLLIPNKCSTWAKDESNIKYGNVEKNRSSSESFHDAHDIM